eukprot:3471738-Pyramimonas_sp.AAC.2
MACRQVGVPQHPRCHGGGRGAVAEAQRHRPEHPGRPGPGAPHGGVQKGPQARHPAAAPGA